MCTLYVVQRCACRCNNPSAVGSAESGVTITEGGATTEGGDISLGGEDSRRFEPPVGELAGSRSGGETADGTPTKVNVLLSIDTHETPRQK